MLKFISILIDFLSFITLSDQQVPNMKVAKEGVNVVITINIITLAALHILNNYLKYIKTILK